MKGSSSRPRFQGKAAAKSSGVVIGIVQKLNHHQKLIPEFNIQHQDVDHEYARFKAARIQASRSIQDEIAAIKQEHGSDDVVLILEVHEMMLHDPELISPTEDLIAHELINAEWALKKILVRLADHFSQIKDEYLRNRKADVEHVGQRILSHLTTAPSMGSTQPIMIAMDFSPSHIVNIWREGMQGFVSVQGGPDSHAMIVARGLGLTGLAGVQGLFDLVEDGDALIVDAEQGFWILNPNHDERRYYSNVQQSLSVVQERLKSYVSQPSTSQSGYTMPLMANLEFAEEVAVATSFGVDGIGLFRTEFLFMQKDSLPSQATQREYYQQVVQHLAGKPVTIRLLDIGADKVAPCMASLGLAKSSNPALGLRGVRLLLRHPQVLETQLRAIVQAAEFGSVCILIPMVSQVSEVEAVRTILNRIKVELGAVDHIALGCMIEVPAAALIADELAKVSDFLSIGSNDLMQYSLAVDRADEHVSYLYDANHPAIKTLIEMVVDAAHRHQKPVSLCGELAANPTWTQFFLDIKVTSLSMGSRSVLSVRKQLQALS